MSDSKLEELFTYQIQKSICLPVAMETGIPE